MKFCNSYTLLFTIYCASTCSLYSHTYFTSEHEAFHLALRYLPENPIILEAGAYDGSDSLYMARTAPRATLHSFEPVPKIYQRLVHSASLVPNIRTYQVALGNAIGKATMYISDIVDMRDKRIGTASSSLREPKAHLTYAPHIKFTHTITVPITTIDAWASQYGITKIDFMWLDMQGAELDALKCAHTILKTVRVIFTEISGVEAYKGQCFFSELKMWLEAEGFTLIATQGFDPHNPPCWSNALFARL